jgi:hypothetical protein
MFLLRLEIERLIEILARGNIGEWKRVELIKYSWL